LSQAEPEFDVLSDEYDALLRDPIRDRFTSGTSQFFHLRKRDLIRGYFRRRQIDARKLSYLDLGCGKGDLLTLLREDFAQASGCDPSPRMLDAGRLSAKGIPIRIQREDGEIPFETAQFDLVTAVCVYHHVPPLLRDHLTAEVGRVLKPGGIFAIIEHNPYNPVTRLIVRRTPVDAGAILLSSAETRGLLQRWKFAIDDELYFLFFPERIYGRAGQLESALRWLPLGGQYAVFGKSEG
jgi:SAM-dependent methyltransferase